VALRPIVFFRREDGAVVALEDRCPHRFAPPSLGRLVGDHVQCGYHGLEFDVEGRCAKNPHGPCLDRMQVRAFPTVERYDLIWVWPGDPAGADPDRIPDLSHLYCDGRRTRFQHLEADYRYDILVDNLMDLSHTGYLHRESAGGPAQERATTIRDEGDVVVVEDVNLRQPPPSAFGPDGPLTDIRVITRWHPGNVIPFDAESVPSGEPLGAGHHLRFTHICTPSTASGTHYFFSLTRDADDDEAGDGASDEYQRGVVVDEDSPMLSAINRVMAGRELMDMQPVLLPTDRAGLRVRRAIDRLIAAEQRAGVDDERVRI
jgi:vanillate O-demethylase monooxygenase subunit